MQVIYFLPLLLLSSVQRLSADYDAVGNFMKRLDQRADDKLVWDNDTVRDYVKGGVSVDNLDRQNVTSDGRDVDLDHDFDNGKVSQKTLASQATFSESYGGFTNKSESDIFTRAHFIAARSTETCKFPTVLKESEIDCTTYPSKVVCIHTCMFGHTFEGKDGTKRRMECIKEENVWKPVPEFEKCKPFVDCGVTVGPGGSYMCRKNYMYKGPDCDIVCSAYEDKEAVPTAKYECDISGNWTPQLPFCAKGGSGLNLVPAPQGHKQLSDKK